MDQLRLAVFSWFALLAFSMPAPAQLAQIYISNENQNSLQQLDFSPLQLATLYPIGASPDDMIVNSLGQIIYSIPKSGTVAQYDPATGISTTLFTSQPWVRDLFIEPGGQTILVAKHVSPAEILRYNFASGAVTVLVKGKNGSTYDGICYDVYGNLYVVANNNTIVQMNPATGATIATLTLEAHNGVNGGDGITYDSHTNSLWATMEGKVLGPGLVQIPVGPSGFVSTSPGFTFYSLPAGNSPDGIKSDGKGNLYIAAIFNALVYNVVSHSIVTTAVTKGADGLDLVPGTY